MTELPYVMIKWRDHQSFEDQGWRSFDDAERLLGGAEVWTCGWILKEDETSVVVVQSVDTENEKFTGCMAILKGLIIERTDIESKKS